jgi:hypothetical protein
MHPFVRRIALASLLVGGFSAFAQSDNGTPTTTQTKKKAQNLSPAEMVAAAKDLQSTMVTQEQEITRLQGVARKKGDVVKLDCVNEQAAGAKVKMNVADTAVSEIDAAMGKGESPAKSYGDISGAASEMKDLLEKARQCLGNTELAKQEDGVKTNAPDVPDDPGKQDPYHGEHGVVMGDPPNVASPY